MAYQTGRDLEISMLLQQIRDLLKVLIRQVEIITDNEDLEDE